MQKKGEWFRDGPQKNTNIREHMNGMLFETNTHKKKKLYFFQYWSSALVVFCVLLQGKF
jgi:hypothetical protein